MAQCISHLLHKPDDLGIHVWWRKKTDSQRLSCDYHIYRSTCKCAHMSMSYSYMITIYLNYNELAILSSEAVEAQTVHKVMNVAALQ